MSKYLTLALFAGALLPGCIIDTNTTDSNSDSDSNNGTTDTTPEGTTTGTSTDPSVGTSTDTTGTSTDDPTTEPTPTSTDPGTTTDPGTSTDPDTDTGGPLYGMCGWNDDENYYDCAPTGTPGLEDPEMIDLIACPDLTEGDKCTAADGPVTSIGCCAPNGDLFYCEIAEGEAEGTVVLVACGA